jgi:DNA (cytosine-5)-methyltransferase 1
VKFISLFAGVGGFDEGMRRAGHECVAMVEWDRAAAGVLAYRYPDVPLYCDVSKVLVDDLPDCDFLTYGFPCQDLSVAGKRKGLEGERSGLFFEATRLIRGLHARGSGFRFAVAENVKGLFSADDGHAFARCIRELRQCGASEIGWSVYDSQYFGLAQRRKRVFIVSDFGGESCDQVLAITESLHGNTAPKREAWKGASGGTGSGFTASSYGGYERGCGTLRSEGGDLGGGSETLAVKTYDPQAIGNIVESDVSGTITRNTGSSGETQTPALIAQGADVYNGELTGDTAATVTSATGIANASGPKVVQPIAIQGSMIGRKEKNGPQGSGYSEDGTSFTLTKTDQHAVCHETNASGPKVMALGFKHGQSAKAHGLGIGEEISPTLLGGEGGAQKPAVCSWNGDVTPKASEDVSVTLRSQQGGEGVGVAFQQNERSEVRYIGGNVAGSLAANPGMQNQNFVQQGGEGVGVAFGTPWDAQRARIIDENGVAPTLSTGAENSGNITPAVAQMNPTVYQEDGKTVEGMCAMRGATMVRRLTPMECERLQGFPDGWTSNRCILELEGNRWKPMGKVEEQKDGPRYRQMGNAVSVPVAEYLGHRMAQAV